MTHITAGLLGPASVAACRCALYLLPQNRYYAHSDGIPGQLVSANVGESRGKDDYKGHVHAVLLHVAGHPLSQCIGWTAPACVPLRTTAQLLPSRVLSEAQAQQPRRAAACAALHSALCPTAQAAFKHSLEQKRAERQPVHTWCRAPFSAPLPQ